MKPNVQKTMELLEASILRRKPKCSWLDEQQRDDLRHHCRVLLEEGLCAESLPHLLAVRDQCLYPAAVGGGFDEFCTTYLGLQPGEGDALLVQPKAASDQISRNGNISTRQEP